MHGGIGGEKAKRSVWIKISVKEKLRILAAHSYWRVTIVS
jgi:hypothetical protein